LARGALAKFDTASAGLPPSFGLPAVLGDGRFTENS
jgi:hypothetical protein